MSTSVLVPSDDRSRDFYGSDETRLEHVRQSARKKSKSSEQSQKKKQPQRGMGVAQLERLRLQERWKKMTEIHPLRSFGPYHPHFFPSSFPDPTPTCDPLQPAKFSGNGFGPAGSNQDLTFPRLGNGRFHGLPGSSGVGGALTEQILADPSGVGARNQSFQVGNAIEISRETSSTPNMLCFSERCGVCHKKKRFNGENFGCDGMRDMCTDVSPINGPTFLGFNLGNNQNICGRSREFGTRSPNQAVYASHNVDQEVEVVAVHRKGSSGSNGSVFMEYEFFPERGDKSTSYEELKLSSEASVAVESGEASFFTTSTAPDSSNRSIDLSLKLSY